MQQRYSVSGGFLIIWIITTPEIVVCSRLSPPALSLSLSPPPRSTIKKIQSYFFQLYHPLNRCSILSIRFFSFAPCWPIRITLQRNSRKYSLAFHLFFWVCVFEFKLKFWVVWNYRKYIFHGICPGSFSKTLSSHSHYQLFATHVSYESQASRHNTITTTNLKSIVKYRSRVFR